MYAFHHVSISVKDLARSIAFYRLFGFEHVLQWVAPDGSLTIVHLKLGSTLLELFCYAQSTDDRLPLLSMDADLRHLGLRHFALRTASLEAALQQLRTAGVNPQSEITEGRTGIRYFFTRDPDGIFVEIVEDERQFVPPMG
jgi:glyoxylase I family protein